MPGLTFGLGSSKAPAKGSTQPQKRKALFDEETEDVSPQIVSNGSSKSSRLRTAFNNAEDENNDKQDSEPPKKSPKLSVFGRSNGTQNEKYANLSSLRSAKIEDQKASEVDASVYDYDAAYETFHATDTKNKNKDASSGPKYMNSLLQTAEIRKRDQLRAREKLLQREREAEGDEFADKEKFVTGAYKQQQEEVKRMEEEEKRREADEEERRRKGEGMKGFYGSMLKREEERMKAVEEAANNMERRQDEGEASDKLQAEAEVDEAKMAKVLNEKGARIVVNDEGEVVDKRQLLTAGLNMVPQKSQGAADPKPKSDTNRPSQQYMSSRAINAKEAQRERQSRMVERQIEEIAEKERQQELEEQRQQEEKSKSRITEADKSGARERYLQRKKGKEEEARKAKELKEAG